MCEKQNMQQLFIQFINYVWYLVHVSVLSISQKALGALPEDHNVMPKHVGATISN
jgi:hypothetical protein